MRKQATREYHNQWYQDNKERRKKQIQENRLRVRVWFEDYKSSLSCSICGEDHPATLDFHHIDSKQKEASISKMVHSACSISSILIEIEKCTVLCSNCHRKFHYNRPV